MAKSYKKPQPERVFENYVLTRSVTNSDGLSNIAPSKFQRTSGFSATALFGAHEEGSAEGISGLHEIGFNFEFNGTTYKKFVASAAGWMALVDPGVSNFVSTDIFNLIGVLPADNNNNFISPAFLHNHVLIAPWFFAAQTNKFGRPPWGTPWPTKQRRVEEGYEHYPVEINESDFGVRYAYNDHPAKGRSVVVRWSQNPGSDLYLQPFALMGFEAVLYENGTIEFRYASLQPGQEIVGPFQNEWLATTGIFISGSGHSGPYDLTYNFRDFSYGLGYNDHLRTQYIFGGAVSGSGQSPFPGDPRGYEEEMYVYGLKIPYSVGLRYDLHWPGGGTERGGMYTFSPPKNRRKILPRNEIRVSDSRISMPVKVRTGNNADEKNVQNLFDDRLTVRFHNSSDPSSLVNFPTTLNRFYGDSTPGITNRQDLFSDFEFTGSITPSTVEQFVKIDNRTQVIPFSEHNLFENGVDSDDSTFYSNVESINHNELSLTNKLKSKTQIRLSFSVNNSIRLPTTQSAIFYYDHKAAGWAVPQNSTYILDRASTINDSGVPKGDIAFLSGSSEAASIPEDHRGFGPVGNFVVSGNIERVLSGSQTDPSIGIRYNTESAIVALSKPYAKSITNNEEYRAQPGEVFSLPINHPFVLEKAVIEIPFAMGDGWFKDKTTTSIPNETSSGSFDFGGPGITFALFNQHEFGKSSSKRDLILSGTFTHAFDNTSNLIISQTPPVSNNFHGRLEGFRAFSAEPTVVVNHSSSSIVGYNYTGSVVMQCESQISNGVLVRLEMACSSGISGNDETGMIQILTTKEIPLKTFNSTFYSQSCNIAYINNFGRGGTGFEPSPRSVFGKEFTTSQKVNSNGKINNPFYSAEADTLHDLGLLGGANGVLNVFGGPGARFNTLVSLDKNMPSPYLVLPTDKLVLAISKTRPVYFGSESPFPHTSGSITHDVQLITGAINLVLYGSLLRENKEYHDTLNQQIGSDAVYEIAIGNQPVLDQFSLAYKESYLSSSYDEIIKGNLITRIKGPDGTVSFVTGNVVGSPSAYYVNSIGSRGRVQGKTQSRSLETGSLTSLYDTVDSRSYSYTLQPKYELAGSPRVNQCFDSSERYIDSMLPGIDLCLEADGSAIFIHHTWDVVTGNESFISGGVLNGLFERKRGFVFFDFQAPYLLDSPPPGVDTNSTIMDGIWTKSFPYEPRYAKIGRQLNIAKSFNATRRTGTGTGELQFGVKIKPVKIEGFYFGPLGTQQPSVPPVQHSKFANHETPYDGAQYEAQKFTDGANEFGGPSGWYTHVNTADVYALHTYNWATDIPDLTHKTASYDGYSYVTSSANISDSVKYLYGFGDLNNIVKMQLPYDPAAVAQGASDAEKRANPLLGHTYFGTNHWPDSRTYARVRGTTGFGGSGSYPNPANNLHMSPIIRGWKYGVISGLPLFSKAYYVQNHYGHFRDMLEQRQYTQFYQSPEKSPNFAGFKAGGQQPAVEIRFRDINGNETDAANTWSQNLSSYATSSVPYFDGETRNRNDINQNVLNTNTLMLNSNQFNLVSL